MTQDTPAENQPTDANASSLSSLLRNRNFQFLWAGQTVSTIGDQMSGLALPVLAVVMLNATEWQVGLMNAAGLSAFLLIGLPAGAWVDRWVKRRVMIWADVVRMLTVASVPLVWWSGHLTMWYVIATAAVMSVAAVFFDVSYQSVLPLLLPKAQLQRANSALETTAQTSSVAGPAVIGFLLTIFKAPMLMIADAFSFLVSWVGIALMKVDETPTPKQDRQPLRKEIAEGVRFVAKHPIISRITWTTSVSNLFSSAIQTLMPILVLRTMGVPAPIYGLMFTAGAVGGLIGAVSAPKLGKWIGEGNLVIAAITLCGVAGFAFPLAAIVGNPAVGIPLIIVAEGLISFTGLVYNITQVSARQALCPEHLLGRMNASIRFFVWGVMPISAISAGALATWFGIIPVMIVAAIGAACAGLFVFFSPLRGMKNIVEEAGQLAG
ncbi:MAG: MFS transporter [Actinomycetales bacterium]|nr:MFS transporter [Actinomycetales bacterium]